MQSKEILLNLSMKFWNSAFNAQGSRVIIVVAKVRTVKIYVAAEVLRKKEREDETQFTTKIGENTSLGPHLFRFVKFHSQLCLWCPGMPKLAVLAT